MDCQERLIVRFRRGGPFIGVDDLSVAPLPGYEPGTGQVLQTVNVYGRILGIRTSWHYGHETAASSIRVTGGSLLGATNTA